ncbi:hypothetical protein CPB83DRAFT_905452 [Crepidotus variabilis]|uniref:F-box domain-containing protein n=1 Tax=Crepidotus variabilis TaxID=179855 RepID=A0A9P6EJF6_9AGAR|nr:hypothetical protein CPB83DRAFT_905452 [Crepidotus variabilis]
MPLEDLPNEVIAEIFVGCLPQSGSYHLADPKKAPLLLTRICSPWRSLAHETPHLWTNLWLEPQLPSSPDRPARSQDECIDQYRHWRRHAAQSLPFDLRLSLASLKHLDVDPSAFWLPLVSTIAENTSNLRNLFIITPEFEYCNLLWRLPNSMPMLETLYIYSRSANEIKTNDVRSIQAFSQAPALRIAILDYRPDRRELIALPWAQLSHLAVSFPITDTKFRNLLGSCLNLQELTVILDRRVIISDQTPARDIHTNLRRLDITFDIHVGQPSPAIFLLVQFSALHSLAFRNVTVNGGQHFQWLQDSPAREHLLRQFYNLRRLKLGFQRLSCEILLEIFKVAPQIVELALDTHIVNYVQLLDTLTYVPSTDQRVFLPHLENFQLYIEVAFEISPGADIPFSVESFISMITSRSKSFLVKQPPPFELVPLKQVYLCIEDRDLDQWLDVEELTTRADSLAETDNMYVEVAFSQHKEEWLEQEVGIWEMS